jgi:nucleotide-binding universal stress UspA family protein
MSIVCGTDFSEHAARGLTAAAHLARRTQLPLHLAHSLDLSSQLFEGPTRDAYVNEAKSRLEQEAARLRALGANVSTHLESGPPDEVLLTLATEVSASLIVITPFGQRRSEKWALGSHADRLVRRSSVPVLVVRDPAPFEAFARDERPLRVVLGADRSLTSAAAMQWVNQLRTTARCEVIAVHLYWPPAQFKRLGLSGVRSYLEPDPEVQRTLERELYEHLRTQDESGSITLRVEPNLGRIGDRIAAIADEEHADLIVVGSHDRSSVARLWEGSVSHDTLHEARVSVACVPSSAQLAVPLTPHVRTVVAATDFSSIGNATVPLAYSVVEPGGTVHLVHVMKDRGHEPTAPRDVFTPSEDAEVLHKQGELEQQLLQLVPFDTLSTNKATQLHVLESNDAAQAIYQAAERLGADLLCVGTRGRSGLTKTVLGSVAHSVLSKTQRPVLLSHAPAH